MLDQLCKLERFCIKMAVGASCPVMPMFSYKKFSLMLTPSHPVLQIGLRWRTEKEVISGKGRFTPSLSRPILSTCLLPVTLFT